MQSHPVLGQVALGYSPVIDRQRAVVATRLSIFPDRPDAAPDAPALLRALAEVWPAPEGEPELKLTLRPLDPAGTRAAASPATAQAPARSHPVSLNIAGEALLQAVMRASPPPHLMLEVPAFMATDPAHAAALQGLREGGSVLLIKGRPLTVVAPEILACFSHCIVDAGDDRRSGPAPAPGVRQVSTVHAGARTAADIEQAFQHGAVAVIGWPFDDPPPKAQGRTAIPADVQVVMALIQAVEREEPIASMEASLRRDPTLAFRLLRYLNSPAFGLSAEVNSFGHAVMMLGYQRLKRWLAVLLASSCKGVNAQPLMHAAVHRGLMMEELARSNSDDAMRGEMFICGVFSLLDRLMQQPIQELLTQLPVPERVQQTLCGEGGPYAPYLDLVRAVEQEAVFEVRERTERLLMDPAEVNRAVLVALRSGRLLHA